MFSSILDRIGMAIRQASRTACRLVLGLRLPAARIRISDLQKNRDFCEQRLADAHADKTYWEEELMRAEESLAHAEWHHDRLLNLFDDPAAPSRRIV